MREVDDGTARAVGRIVSVGTTGSGCGGISHWYRRWGLHRLAMEE